AGGAARVPAAPDVGGAGAPAARPRHRGSRGAGPPARDCEGRIGGPGRVRCACREPRRRRSRPRGRRIDGCAHRHAHFQLWPELLRRATMADKYSGIIDPPIDELLSKVDSKYQLVIFASKRARQINDYYADLHEGSLFDNVGPLVDSTIDDKPLSVALHEINEDKLVLTPLAE